MTATRKLQRAQERAEARQTTYGRKKREQRTRARGLKSYLILGGGHNSPELFPSRARSLARLLARPPEYFNITGVGGSPADSVPG